MEGDVRPAKNSRMIEDEFQHYDVFISHRGPDTKAEFVGFLYEYLKEAGLWPFLDCKVIQKGQDAWTCIEHAIKTTSIALVVFSENFAQSMWCLDELHLILNTPGIKVLPVFYKVQPCDVRYPEKGPFAVAFDKLKQRHNETIIEQWKKDLESASKLIGWERKVVDQSLEIDLVKDIVKKVFELAPKAPPLHVGEFIFGIKEVAIEIIQTLDDKKKVVMLGLWGPGGIGKSTLAKELYNRLRKRFARVCYVEDVKDKTVQSNGITEVQNNMLNDLVSKGTRKKITNRSAGKVALEKALCERRILLVFDDISDIDDMSSLISRKMLREGSLCIITSRNKCIFYALNALEKHEIHIHDVQGLSSLPSVQVLASYAFGDHHKAKSRFEGLMATISQACGGIPLVLKVSGSLLKNEEDMDVWRDVVKNLKNGIVLDDAKIFNCLRISYDALKNEQYQEMFLDITCALLGKPRDLVVRAWSSHGWCGALGMQTLENRALVTVDKNGCLRMHDQLRDMGREIIRRRRESDGVIRRLWMPESTTLLEEDVGLLESLETLVVFHRSPYLRNDLDLSHMKKLRIIRCDDSTYIAISSIPKSLCWWDWYGPWLPGGQTRRILPTVLPKNKLVILNLERSACTMFPETFQELKNLEVLNLKGCEKLFGLPESFGDLKKLRDLNLESSRILSLPESFGGLRNLEVLNLARCQNLLLLPHSIRFLQNVTSFSYFGSAFRRFLEVVEGIHSDFETLKIPLKLMKLSSMLSTTQKLKLGGVEKLEALPESFGDLGNLEELSLAQCEHLKLLPHSFGCLTKLRCLELSWSGVSALPDSFGDLSNLEILSLNFCSNLKLLPHSFGRLRKLRELNFKYSKVISLPDSFEDLTNLEVLNLWRINWTLLPRWFGGLRKLRELNLNEVEINSLLHSFKDLTNLEVLSLAKCPNLSLLPSWFCGLGKLRDLNLNFSRFNNLPDSFGDLSNLELLSLKGCSNLQLLPHSFGLLGKLRDLKLDTCGVNSLPDSFGDLSNLELLSLEGCSNLQLLPYSFGLLRKLRDLKLDACGVNSLPDSFRDLSNLELLSLEGCSNLQLLPHSFGLLGMLRDLKLDACGVDSLPDSFGDLSNLELLSLKGCLNLQLLPYSFGLLRNLRDLKLYACGMSSLPDSFGDLSNLEALRLVQCKTLEFLPKSFGSLKRLRYLDLASSRISSLPESFGGLSNLFELDLSWCSSLKALPQSFTQLSNLHRLNLDGCPALIDFMSLQHLMNKYVVVELGDHYEA